MTEMTIVNLPVQATAVIRERVAIAELTAFFGRAFAAVATELGRQGVSPSGPPFASYQHPRGETTEVEAGFPVSGPVRHAGQVVRSHLPGGPALQAEHLGSYDTLPETYAAMEKWIRSEGLNPAEEMWECYLSGPGDSPDPAGWRTLVNWPVV